jgi:hypothetical protein
VPEQREELDRLCPRIFVEMILTLLGAVLGEIGEVALACELDETPGDNFAAYDFAGI